MMLDDAIRATEILMALAFIQQSAEHLKSARTGRWLFGLRIGLCGLLIWGTFGLWALAGLAVISLILLQRFQGPYNGGSDRMSILILWCLLLAQLAPSPLWQAAAMGYLAVQLTLSYFVSGWVKLLNHDWRSGRALRDVFGFSAYPVSEQLRSLSDRPKLCWVLSWAVILFELLLPFALLHQNLLIGTLVIAAVFHLANACLFGLNRFFWIWLSAYPSLLWFQGFIHATF
jgi:hypothetical protein